MSRVLGLDLGSNSIGWALIDEQKEQIIDSGVRVFQEGINRNTSGSEVSKNKDRRDARGARRQNFRYKMRRDTLVNSLKKIGLYPENKDDLQEFFEIDPYEVRKNGLTEKLSLHEFGRALYHISQRRGFKSNRKTASKEDGAIFKGNDNTTGIDSAREQMNKQSCLTIGEYLASIDTGKERRRNRYTLRDWYEQEFEKLWEKQQSFYPDLLTEKEKQHFFKVIFFQRKLRSQKHTVGYCTFEKKKRCAPKSSPVFQYFRILEQINRIRIITDDRINEPLTQEERGILINKLNIVKDLDFKKLKKLLKLPEDTIINLDLDKLLGNNTYYEIQKIFGKPRFAKMTDDEKFNIWHTLHFSNDDEWLCKYARKNWSLNDEEIKKLMRNGIENKPNDGYARLSSKALKKFIPYLEEGLRYDEAAREAGYHHSQVNNNHELFDFLQDPPNIRNPIVQQALFQLKKVINALIQEYGKPDMVRVELARELKLPKDRREKIRIENKQRQTEAEKIRELLKQEMNFIKPERDDVIKYLLWQECNKRDPYSGKFISLAELYSPEYEIEHIIPYSRSLDDSYANKTLCRRDYNKEKGNKTPFEAFGHKPEFEFMVRRVKDFNISGRNGKLAKFQLEKVDEKLSEEFFHRQLNDTAYISRAAAAYLKTVFPKVHIVKGGATAKLRYFWGLNSILSGDIEVKTRDDHRHHAVDALVVANINQPMLHELSVCNKYNINVDFANDNSFPMPWKNFHQQAEKSVNNILVSFFQRNRARGKLHEETNYGEIIDPETGKKTYVVRKPVQALTGKMIRDIVNRETRQVILDRLREKGADITGKKLNIPKETFAEPLFHPKTGHPIKSVRVKVPSTNMIRLYEDRNLFVEPGKNHHIEIFASADKKQKTGYVVTLYEAVQRKKQGLPVINKTPLDKKYPHFVMSLAINDMFLHDMEEKDVDWDQPDITKLSPNLYRVQKMDVNKNIALRYHTITLSDQSDPGALRKIPNTLFGIKVKIDPLGRIGPCYD
ncbi:type II CRISPR RNA-guided endonuclease Cas9 [candidate division KSB1 bacterium]|nr:type II CRISPR RNA-guided endonuclease Cas9 [candidate division KSB1 bacterium]